MSRSVLLTAAIALLLSAEAHADPYEFIGVGTMFSNDFLGDGEDRWRTGSFTVSTVFGRGWNGALPERLGDVIELRFRNEIIAPENLDNPAPDDRPYVGILAFGVHTHFERAGIEASLGVDLVATGPMTGVESGQQAVHRFFGDGFPDVPNQIGNAIRPTLVAEVGHVLRLGGQTTLRPFLELQAGAETFLRAGGDLAIGDFGSGALLVREQMTGQRYPTVSGGGDPGYAFVVGFDIARVFDSDYLPSDQGYVLDDWRERVRIGVEGRWQRMSAFYGLTYMGREFSAQDEGQVVGTLDLAFRF